jgi:hypothetical protein
MTIQFIARSGKKFHSPAPQPALLQGEVVEGKDYFPVLGNNIPLSNNVSFIFYVYLFIISTLVMAITKNYMIVTLWISVWLFSFIQYNANTPKIEYLLFIMGIYFFFPQYDDIFMSIHNPEIVLSLILIIILVLNIHSIFKGDNYHKSFTLLFWGWLSWGIICYIPVFFSTIGKGSIIDQLNLLPQISLDSTALKTVIPILAFPIISFIPVFSLKKYDAFEVFWKALAWGTLITCVLALIKYAFSIDIIPYQAGLSEGHDVRIDGFSVFSSNNFGRQLVLPSLFLSSLIIVSKRISPIFYLIVGICYSCIIMTFSRTTYMSIIIGTIVVLLMTMGRTKKVIFYLAALSLFIIILFSSADVLQRFHPDAERASVDNLIGRQVIYQMALQILWDNPFFGCFPGLYGDAMRAQGFHADYVPSAHNMLLAIAVEWGTPMALLLLGANLLSLVNGIKSIKFIKKAKYRTESISNMDMITSMAYGNIAVAVTYFVHGITEIVPPYYVFLNLGLSEAVRNLMNYKNPAFRSDVIR